MLSVTGIMLSELPSWACDAIWVLEDEYPRFAERYGANIERCASVAQRFMTDRDAVINSFKAGEIKREDVLLVHAMWILLNGVRLLKLDEQENRRKKVFFVCLITAAQLLASPDLVISEQARFAARALHNKPGGSREKRSQIQAIWATGKYSSRDVCAEQECAALGMSFSTARKALRGTPRPS